MGAGDAQKVDSFPPGQILLFSPKSSNLQTVGFESCQRKIMELLGQHMVIID
jgi:hypothetical protein